MILPKQPEHPQAAFTMSENDRFHSILISSPVKYEICPDTETLLCFFIIHRASGKLDIFNILKTFNNDKCISRNIQSKHGILEDEIDLEVQNIQVAFSAAIEAETNCRIEWHVLDLSKVQERNEQIQKMKQWGKLSVFSSDLLN